jgi:hypothetical protein
MARLQLAIGDRLRRPRDREPPAANAAFVLTANGPHGRIVHEHAPEPAYSATPAIVNRWGSEHLVPLHRGEPHAVWKGNPLSNRNGCKLSRMQGFRATKVPTASFCSGSLPIFSSRR